MLAPPLTLLISNHAIMRSVVLIMMKDPKNLSRSGLSRHSRYVHRMHLPCSKVCVRLSGCVGRLYRDDLPSSLEVSFISGHHCREFKVTASPKLPLQTAHGDMTKSHSQYLKDALLTIDLKLSNLKIKHQRRVQSD